LFEHGIYQGSLTMVNMSNNSYVSYVAAIIHIMFAKSYILNYYNGHYYDVREVQMPIHTLHE